MINNFFMNFKKNYETVVESIHYYLQMIVLKKIIYKFEEFYSGTH